MAVVRIELMVNETEELVKLLDSTKMDRQHPLWRARREIKRGLERGQGAEQAERENMARIRRNRRPMTMADEPLIPQSVSRPAR